MVHLICCICIMMSLHRALHFDFAFCKSEQKMRERVIGGDAKIRNRVFEIQILRD